MISKRICEKPAIEYVFGLANFVQSVLYISRVDIDTARNVVRGHSCTSGVSRSANRLRTDGRHKRLTSIYVHGQHVDLQLWPAYTYRAHFGQSWLLLRLDQTGQQTLRQLTQLPEMMKGA